MGLGSAATAGAADYLAAYPVNYPILVNGVRVTFDKPIVSINGSTYMPLRALGEALGETVGWNAALNSVGIRNDANFGHYGRLKIVCLGTWRDNGKPRYRPREGCEYLIVKVKLENTSDGGSTGYSLSSFQVKDTADRTYKPVDNAEYAYGDAGLALYGLSGTQYP